MARSLPIAIAQTPVGADIAANGRALRAAMRQAADAGARLLVTAEGALSIHIGKAPPAWDSFDWPLLASELAAIAALAAELRLWCALGTLHRQEGAERPTNSLQIISDRGALVGRYDKRICSYREARDLYVEGEEPLIFEVEGFRIGCALCIEIQFPEIFAGYEEAGADAVILPAYSQDPIFTTLAQAHAEITAQWIALATPAQYGSRLPSALLGPNGQICAQAARITEPSLLLATLDRDDPAFAIALTKARPWRRARRSGTFYQDQT